MMKLFIQIQNQQPIEHPLLEDNVRQVWPDIDLDNLPIDRLAPFIRVPLPAIDIYEVYEGTTYEWQDNYVRDVHHIRAMTDEEKSQVSVSTTDISPPDLNV